MAAARPAGEGADEPELARGLGGAPGVRREVAVSMVGVRRRGSARSWPAASPTRRHGASSNGRSPEGRTLPGRCYGTRGFARWCRRDRVEAEAARRQARRGRRCGAMRGRSRGCRRGEREAACSPKRGGRESEVDEA